MKNRGVHLLFQVAYAKVIWNLPILDLKFYLWLH